jgi:uncharacterized damage-inducible protein DinB
MPNGNDKAAKAAKDKPQAKPEVWLRGPIAGMPDLLMPAAHAFVQVGEEVADVAAGLSADELWQRPGGAASAGFHLKHLVGATDRLLTYARGETLTPAQLAFLKTEGAPGSPPESAEALIAGVHEAIAAALNQLRSTSLDALTDKRTVGRAALPTTVIGLLFHAAEHATRHAGQLTTIVKVVRAGQPATAG